MEQKMMDKLVIVINGKGGVGKDTLCDALAAVYRVTNISSITPIKEIAARYGWQGEKTDRARRFLAELKRVFVEYNDLPTRYLLDECERFAASDDQILCVHIREKEEIAKFVASVTLPCVTLLVRRELEDHGGAYGNAADDGVEDYSYDYVFDNNAGVEESAEKFRALIGGIMNR